MPQSQLTEQLPPDWYYCVAYSGGLDSTVLLHAATAVLPADRLRALHVHHGLSSHADHWQRHCEQTCERLGVSLTVERVRVAPRGGGLEEAAREARHRAFRQQLESDEVLLTAHHADDQLETLLLRLARGSGPDGLGGMAPWRRFGAGMLCRPLLALPRATLEAYARHWTLSWIEDESNEDTGFDRNYLRHRVVPLLADRWPGIAGSGAVSAGLCRASASLLADYAREDSRRLRLPARGPEAVPVLSISGLRQLGDARRDQVLRVWLMDEGSPVPSRGQLAQLVSQLLEGRADARAEVRLAGGCLRRFGDGLYRLPRHRPSLPAAPVPLAPLTESQTLALDGGGTLHIERSDDKAAGPRLRAGLSGLTVRWREGGERCRPAGRPHSQTLKKLLQAYGLPPWWRDRAPLLYCGDALAAVGDLWVCEGFAAADDEPGYRLRWCG